MQTLAADVQGLRKGLDLTKSERDKQPENFIIFVSFCFFLLFFVFFVVQHTTYGNGFVISIWTKPSAPTLRGMVSAFLVSNSHAHCSVRSWNFSTFSLFIINPVITIHCNINNLSDLYFPLNHNDVWSRLLLLSGYTVLPQPTKSLLHQLLLEVDSAIGITRLSHTYIPNTH